MEQFERGFGIDERREPECVDLGAKPAREFGARIVVRVVVLRDVFLGAAQRRPHRAERVRVERRQVERRAGEARVVGAAGQSSDEQVDDGRLDRLGHEVRRPSRGGIGSAWVVFGVSVGAAARPSRG